MTDWRPGLPSEPGVYDVCCSGMVLRSVGIEPTQHGLSAGIHGGEASDYLAPGIQIPTWAAQWLPIPVPEGV